MKILAVMESYLPGTLGGGPVRALANMIGQIGDQHDFYIFTRNHDYLQSTAYADLPMNRWESMGRASIYYSEAHRIKAVILEQAQVLQPDWIYLNGALPPLTRLLLQLRKKHPTLRKAQLLLAPHGNLSQQALKHHSVRKQAWLAYAKARGLYHDVIWHAASEREAEQIQAVFGADTPIQVVPMAPRILRSDHVARSERLEQGGSLDLSDSPSVTSHQSSQSNALKLVYFGRLSPEKNLPFAFQLLKDFVAEHPSVSIVYDLIGSGEPSYEAQLRRLSAQLPDQVQVNFIGQLEPEKLQAQLHPTSTLPHPSSFTPHPSPPLPQPSSFHLHPSSLLPSTPHSPLPTPHFSPYHAMLMPSLTENFSYTVLESLQAGIPVLISDQTPWRELESQSVGWDLSLEQKGPWLQALTQLAQSDQRQLLKRSQQALAFADQQVRDYPEKAKQLFSQ